MAIAVIVTAVALLVWRSAVAVVRGCPVARVAVFCHVDAAIFHLVAGIVVILYPPLARHPDHGLAALRPHQTLTDHLLLLLPTLLDNIPKVLEQFLIGVCPLLRSRCHKISFPGGGGRESSCRREAGGWQGLALL